MVGGKLISYVIGLINNAEFVQQENIIINIMENAFTQECNWKKIMDSVSLNAEYIKIIINIKFPSAFRDEALDLILEKNVLPTIECLELGFISLSIKSLEKIMNYKLLPNQNCLINVTSIVYSDDYLSTVHDKIMLCLSYGVKFTPDIVYACVKNAIPIKFEEYDIKCTKELYYLQKKFPHPPKRSIDIKNFLSLPDEGNFIQFLEAIFHSKWKVIANIGYEHKIIPDQECFNLACKSFHRQFPIKLLQHLQIANITGNLYETYDKQISMNSQSDTEIEKNYEQFLKDNMTLSSIFITDDNIRDLNKNKRHDALYLISQAFINSFEQTTEKFDKNF